MSDEFVLDPAADDQKLLAQVVGYYHQALKDASEALDYLRQLGLTHPQLVDRFRIGYADRTLGPKLPNKQLKAGRAIRSRLQQVGLFRASGHEHFNGCVVFPILAADGTGRIVDIYGRKILGERLRKGTLLDVYLGSQRQGVWNVEAFAGSKEIILCPSVFDALTFWSHGYQHVTCTFGPGALTADHLVAFEEFRVRRVLTVAGEVVPQLLAAGLECFQLRLPLGLDVGGYALRMDDPAEALGAVLRQAEWAGKGQAPVVTVPSEAVPTRPTPAEPAESQQAESATEPTANPPVRTASPLPPLPQEIEAEVNEDEVRLTIANRRYRVRGWKKNLSFDVLRVNLLVGNGTGTFMDSLDLYSAKHRRAFITDAAQELRVEEHTIKSDLGRLLLKLEELQDRHINQALTPQPTTLPMTAEEKEAALELLRDLHLLDRIASDCDVVGEATNKLVAYLAAVSRKLDAPLAVVIQSSSAAGKSALMDSVLDLLPPEDLVKYSALTGQALYYMGSTGLQHKVLAVVEGEGAERASYALKLLQSEGELTIASTGKDSSSGRMVTQEYRVAGPVMLFLTTTALTIDEELLNRCLVLTVSEGREQTQAIHQRQRRRQTLEGLLADQNRDAVLVLHRNAQRLLKALLVVNPFAESLTFLDTQTRTRRDHAKYLTLIRAVALLHQHQRPVQTTQHRGQMVEYIEVTLDDIEVANRLAGEVLGHSLDELPPQTRRLLDLLDEMVTRACQQQGLHRADYRFSRRDVRTFTGWGQTQLQLHLRRLVDLEYLLVHRGSRGRSFVYELLYEGASAEGPRFLPGLLDVDQLRRNLSGSGEQLSGSNGQLSGCCRGQIGPISPPNRPCENGVSPDLTEV